MRSLPILCLGAGNISEDHTVYVSPIPQQHTCVIIFFSSTLLLTDVGSSYGDGEIVREGTVGDHGDGAFSTGRGGAANIGGSPALKADQRKDHEIVPEVALRPSMEKENFHTGRGGEGNVHHAEPTPGKPQHPEGLADKLKHKLFGKKKEHTAA